LEENRHLARERQMRKSLGSAHFGGKLNRKQVDRNVIGMSTAIAPDTCQILIGYTFGYN